MQGTSFVVLTGHLNDYPLSNLIGILRRQRKSGRLLIEYRDAPCSLYFVNGDLVDAQLNSLIGLQAIYVALSQPDASFNFNPLIQPPRRSIDGAAQKVLLESLGCWEEKVIHVTTTAKEGFSSLEPSPAAPTPLEALRDELPEAKEVLALPPAPASQNHILKREIFTASAILLWLLSLLTVIALAGWLNRQDSAATRARGKNREGISSTDDNSTMRRVEVTVQVENGRVSRAFIPFPQPGLRDYETLALRIARGRHYPAGTTGEETVSVDIKSAGQ